MQTHPENKIISIQVNSEMSESFISSLFLWTTIVPEPSNSLKQNLQYKTKQLTVESRKGQNFGFPRLPYFSKYAPFLSVAMACTWNATENDYIGYSHWYHS